MSNFSMKSTVKSIFAGENATARLQAELFNGTETAPNPEAIDSLINVLNDDYKGKADKCASINMKVGRMAHKIASELELKKGKYSVPAIKLNDEGVFYYEMVKTRATTKNPLMDVIKAFQKNPNMGDIDKARTIMLSMLETAEKAKNESK